MNKSLSAAVILATFGTAATTANATEDPLIAASGLTRLCESTATAEQLSCVSFLGGVYGATISLGQLIGPPVLCPSRNISGADLLATFRDYARHHPPGPGLSASVLALMAFREAYGCKKSAWLDGPLFALVRLGLAFEGAGSAPGGTHQPRRGQGGDIGGGA
jgi:hypothetical protein